MGLTSALFSGLSGLNASQNRLDVIGDNIANINTTGFKSSRVMFETQFAQTLSAGTKPAANQGGSNPEQVGTGVGVGSIQRSFTAGSLQSTGVPSDLAIEGNGFFVLRTPENESVYSRDGTFNLSADNHLVNADGFFVQGYGVDSNFNIIPGVVKDLTIPVGTLVTAKATNNVTMDGTLNSSGDLATQGSILQSQQLVDAANANAPITATTNLTDVKNPGGSNLFSNGDVITIGGIQRGGRTLPTRTFTVGTTGTTVGDYLNFISQSTGIDTTSGVAGNPGVGVTADGRLEIRGNAGTENELTIPAGTITSSNSGAQVPFSFTEAQAANGESTSTSFIVYDSLGTPIHLNVTMALEARDSTSSTWRFYATSPDTTGASIDVGTGTVVFDSNGQFKNSPSDGVVIGRANSGANDPLPVTLDMSKLSGLDTSHSALVASFQDGFAPGTLIDYSVGQDGSITGTFTNGLNQTLGQVALATFSNPQGLLARNNNIYFVGPNSGDARITPPETLGAGKIASGNLELSNVDLSREFTNLITSSTAFSASSRVITTSDQMLQELLTIARR